jgi:hypothetical protein
VSLVAHHAAYLQSLAARQLGKVACLLGRYAAARQPDVDVDQDLLDAPASRGVDRLRRVDRHRHSCVKPAEPGGVEDLVGEQEVIP